MPKKMKKEGDPEVHEELKGFDINISTFGEIQTNTAIDKLNSFLDKNVEDKKIISSSQEEE